MMTKKLLSITERSSIINRALSFCENYNAYNRNREYNADCIGFGTKVLLALCEKRIKNRLEGRER